MRPTILLDIDGVAANFIAGCLPHVQEITGRSYVHDDVDQFMIERALGLDAEQTERLYAKVCEKGWCRSLPVYDGAKDAVKELKTFADVVPVTSHFFASDYWVNERDEWIVEHLDIPKTDIIHTHRKYQIDGDMLVDDKTTHLIKWAEKHRGVAVRFRRRYNEFEVWRKPPGASEFPNSDWGVEAQDWSHLVRFAKLHFGIDSLR